MTTWTKLRAIRKSSSASCKSAMAMGASKPKWKSTSSSICPTTNGGASLDWQVSCTRKRLSQRGGEMKITVLLRNEHEALKALFNKFRKPGARKPDGSRDLFNEIRREIL